MGKTKLPQLAIVLGVISLIIVVGWVWLFFLISQDRQAVTEANQAREQSLGNRAPLLSLSKEKVSKINSYFLSSQLTVELLDDLEQLGKKAGVKLTIGQANDKAGELDLNLSIDGSFSQTMKILQSLENLPYASRIDRLEMKRGDSSWESVLMLRILKSKE